jgi:hypothetical protein
MGRQTMRFGRVSDPRRNGEKSGSVMSRSLLAAIGDGVVHRDRIVTASWLELSA